VTSKMVGLIVFVIGTLYMVLMGFLLSWWYVPAIMEVGFNDLPFPGVLTLFWSLSAPLGAVIVAIGAALYAQVERIRILYLVVGSLLIFALPAFFAPQEPVSVLFGINGGLIVLFFLGLFWNWATRRSTLTGNQKTGSDLQMVGYIFFLMAAWWLCGLLGAPTFTLRPDLMEKYSTLPGAASMGSLISILLVLGWAFIFWGQRKALQIEN
jgi:hypothetical protein